MATRRYANRQPTTGMPAEAPKDAVKVEFARRLQAAIVQKGWNQSEAAREAEKHMPKGKSFGRDSISHYIRATILPGPVKLKALCDALGKTKEELIPSRGFREVGDNNPTMDVRDTGDGNLWLRINRPVRRAAGFKIMQILAEEDDANGGGTGKQMSSSDDKSSGGQMAVPT